MIVYYHNLIELIREKEIEEERKLVLKMFEGPKKEK